MQLLIKQLCNIITFAETTLIQSFCRFLINIIQNNINFQEHIFIHCKQWFIEVFKFALPITHNDILLALKSFLMNKQFNDIDVSIYFLKNIFYYNYYEYIIFKILKLKICIYSI